MMKKFSQKLAGWLSGSNAGKPDSDEELRIAAAALLVRAAAIDGVFTAAEEAEIHRLLREKFGLNDDEAHTLLLMAKARDSEAVDLYRFTSTLTATMPLEEREQLVEMMWRIAFADGELHALEDNLLWRAAELLGVTARDRMILKKKVAEGH